MLAAARGGPGRYVLAFAGLVPLFFAIANAGPSRAFMLGWLAGTVYNLLLVPWVVHTMVLYGGMPWLEAILCLLLLCAYLGVYWAVFALLLRRAGLWQAPLILMLLEHVIARLFTGFPWTLLGYTQVHNRPLLQLAELGSVYLVGLVLVYVNVCVFHFIVQRRIAWLAMGLAVLAIISIQGLMRCKSLDVPGRTLRVAYAQPNVPQDVKMDRGEQERLTRDIFQLMEQLIPCAPDIIVLPETAFNYALVYSKTYARLLEWTREHRIAVLAGAEDIQFTADRQRRYFNAGFYFPGQNGPVARYYKNHLVPFGEYLPLADYPIINKLRNIIPMDITPGDRREWFTGPLIPNLTIISPICFEVIFPEEIALWLRGHDTRLIATLTNDAWFAYSRASYQHFHQVIFRAVENRCPALMVANTGVSGFVDRLGRAQGMSGLFNRATVCREVTVHKGPQTLWQRTAAWQFYACALAFILLSLLQRRGRVVRARHA